jgi:hypothetical protein
VWLNAPGRGAFRDIDCSSLYDCHEFKNRRTDDHSAGGDEKIGSHLKLKERLERILVQCDGSWYPGADKNLSRVPDNAVIQVRRVGFAVDPDRNLNTERWNSDYYKVRTLVQLAQ